MKAKINISKLVDSPYSASTKGSFVFDDADSIIQLAQELQVANSSTFLVAGYRGVGKTSFVKRLAETLTQTHICAVLNVAKYVSYQALVKRLIRELYIQFKAHSQVKTEKIETLSTEFLLLYDRTFNDIANSQTHNDKSEMKVENGLKVNYKRLIIPIATTILFTFNLAHEIIPSTILNAIFLIGGAIWASVTSWSLGITKGKTSTTTIETSKKTLYDDEIAEHFLFKVLGMLKDNGIKVIIGFDELDKHENNESITRVIDDLKPLLLSGHADFFIIAGQQLNYLYEEAALKENEVISSIFSKVIYVPFLRHSTLQTFCFNLVDDELKNNERLARYFDSLILHSRRIPRRLTNLIRSELKWKDGNAYLHLEDQTEFDYEFDSKLLNALTSITDNMLPKIARTTAQLDFFVAQIHLWILKMKEYGSVQFLMSEVINHDSYLGKIPVHYHSQIWDLAWLLKDELLEMDILGVTHGHDIESESHYFWKTPSRPITEPSPEAISPDEKEPPTEGPSGGDFIGEFAQLESLIRHICAEVNPNEDLRNQTLKILINRFRSFGFFENTKARSEILDEVITARNNIVHGHVVGEEAKQLGQKAQFNLSRLKAEILQEYVHFICSSVLGGFKFETSYQNKFDFSAFKGNRLILFDVKYRAAGHMTSSEITDAISSFERFSKGSTFDCNYILFCFIPGADKGFDFYNLANKIVDDRFSKLKNNIEVVALLEKSSFGIGQSIKKVLSDISKNFIRGEERNYNYFDSRELTKIEANIENEAKNKWPDKNDFDMVLHYIDSEREAVGSLRSLKNIDVSQDEWVQITDKAKGDFPCQYRQQLSIFRNQVDSLHELKRIEASPLAKDDFEKIKSKSRELHPSDYALQLDEVIRQKQALMIIQDMKFDVPESIFEKIKNTAAHTHPDDFELQRQAIEKAVQELSNN